MLTDYRAAVARKRNRAQRIAKRTALNKGLCVCCLKKKVYFGRIMCVSCSTTQKIREGRRG